MLKNHVNQIFTKKIKININTLFPLCIFSSLYSSSFGLIPYLDGGIDFVKSFDFFSGGFKKLFQNWVSVHPPGKEFISLLLFSTLGINKFSYSLIGLVFGIIGIILFHQFVLKLSDKKIANFASILLAANPLFISVGIFSLTDYLLAIFVIGSFYFYLERKWFLMTIFLSFAFLTKETGILCSISIGLVELTLNNKKLIKKRVLFLKFLASILFPFLLFLIWYLFLKLHSKPFWTDWNFSETSSKGSLYTIIHNILSFSFLNKYAYQNWLHLFFLNFNWVYWLLIIVGLLIFIRKTLKNKRYTKITKSEKTKLSITLFFLFYNVIALSYQTFTIPRYILPCVPILILWVSSSIKTITKFLKIKNFYLYLIVPIFSINAVSLFFSLDPISSRVWGKEKIYGEEIYSLRKHLAGNDGITYNLQYVTITRRRTKDILNSAKSGNIISSDCSWIFPDPRNDKRILQALKINIDIEKPCFNIGYLR